MTTLSTRRIQISYYLILSLYWLSTALPMTVVVLLHQERGLNLLQIGLLMGLYSATIVLLEVPTGGLADALGRKRVAAAAVAVKLVSGLVLLFSFSFELFAVAWLLNGLARALSSGALDAWFVDALRAAEPDLPLQPPLARAGTVTLLALGAGALAGGWLPRLLKSLPQGPYLLTPYSATVILAVLLNAVLIVAILLLVREPERRLAESGLKSGFRQVPAIIKDALVLSRQRPAISLLLGAGLAGGLSLAAVETLWQPQFAELLAGGTENSPILGLLLAGSFLAGMLGNLVSIPLSRLLDGRFGFLAAAFQGFRGLFLVLLALQAGALPAALLFWAVYFSMGVLNSPHETLVNQNIPADRRSVMLSVQSMANYLGGIAGGALLGLVAQQASIGLAWIVSGAALLVSLPLYLRVEAVRTDRMSDHASQETVLEAR